MSIFGMESMYSYILSEENALKLLKIFSRYFRQNSMYSLYNIPVFTGSWNLVLIFEIGSSNLTKVSSVGSWGQICPSAAPHHVFSAVSAIAALPLHQNFFFLVLVVGLLFLALWSCFACEGSGDGLVQDGGQWHSYLPFQKMATLYPGTISSSLSCTMPLFFFQVLRCCACFLTSDLLKTPQRRVLFYVLRLLFFTVLLFFCPLDIWLNSSKENCCFGWTKQSSL